MARKWWLAARLSVALAGVAYIAWSVTWTDCVEVPAGLELQPGWVLREPGVFPVVGRASPAADAVTIAIPPGQNRQAQVRLPRERFGHAAEDLKLKVGVLTTIRTARPLFLLLGMAAVAPAFFFQTLRWWLLMSARRLGVGFCPALRLYLVGAFCNYCMPGMTGGDVVKAYYAARDSRRRADAIMSVVVDRVAGMLGLVLLAGLAGLFMLGDPLARRVTAYVWSGILILAAAGIAYLSRSLRRRLKRHALLTRMADTAPLRKIDQAALAYRRHPWAITAAVILSVGFHACMVLAAASSAYALGAQTPIGLLLTVMPLVFMSGTVPISYQGLGVMEGLALALLLQPPAFTANHIVGMLLLVRVYPMLYSLLGSLFLIKGDLRLHPPSMSAHVAVPQRAPA